MRSASSRRFPGRASISRASRARSCCSNACNAGSRVAVVKRGDQSFDERQPLPWRVGDHDCPAVSVCATQPASHIGPRERRLPTERAPASHRAGQWTNWIPAQRRSGGSGSGSALGRRRFEITCSRTAIMCLQRPSEFRRKSAHSQLLSRGQFDGAASGTVVRASHGAASRTAQDPAPRPLDDLNLVRTSGRAPPKHRVERLALDGPVTSTSDRQHVTHDVSGGSTPVRRCARASRV